MSNSSAAYQVISRKVDDGFESAKFRQVSILKSTERDQPQSLFINSGDEFAKTNSNIASKRGHSVRISA